MAVARALSSSNCHFSSLSAMRCGVSTIAGSAYVHLGSKAHAQRSPLLRECGGGSYKSGSRRRSLPVLVCAQVADSSTALNAEPNSVSSKLVLVVGATGAVGQLAVASLIEKGVKVRALVRSAEKAKSLFGTQLDNEIEFRIGDTRQPEVLDESIFEGVTHVINATGTTAFPSKRWLGDNGPEQTDWNGVRNIINALPKTVKKVVLVSSIGVTKSNQLPFNILNLFGVLKYKKMGEDHLRKSGFPFTIIRPGRLTDAGTRRDVTLGQGDELVGEASRVAVAEACVHSLDLKCTEGQTYELSSIEGDGPGKDAEKWAFLFVNSTA